MKSLDNTIKYYELNNLKYLDERMLIYAILNDIRHLQRFKNKELIDNILKNSSKILNNNRLGDL